MCGICGIVSEDRDGGLLQKIEVMNASLTHRGPDAGASFTEAGVALGHRRLSILDLSETGAQPMQRRRDGPVITYNGEVYNFSLLREELKCRGVHFKGRSDTEVVLAVYEEFGLEGIQKLEGIFSFAIWDRKKQTLILVRDSLGVKPLYYSLTGDRLVFASEYKAIKALEAPARRLNLQAVSEYLWYGNVFEDRTFFEDINQLEPGHMLLFEDGAAKTVRWWSVEDWLPDSYGVFDRAETIASIGQTLCQSVDRQLVADVPVGLFLSGGIDSSSIAVSTDREKRPALTSYSIGFGHGADVDEMPQARSIASHLGIPHKQFELVDFDLLDALKKMAWAHDDPFADAANVPLYFMAKRFAQNTKVVLQGDGGDELFAGYRRYQLLQHLKKWRTMPRAAARLAAKFGGTGKRLARLFAATQQNDPAMVMALLMTVETLDDRPENTLTDTMQEALSHTTDPFMVYRKLAHRFEDHDPVQQMLLTDLNAQLPSQFLTKVDRATMAAGVEARVPLLDENMLKLALSIPATRKLGNLQSKVLLRDVLRTHLPKEIVDAPKSGFGVPYGDWIKKDLWDVSWDQMTSTGFLNRFGFDATAIRSRLSEHRSGERNYGFFLYKLLMLTLWHELHP